MAQDEEAGIPLHFPAGFVGFPALTRFELFEPEGGYPLKFISSVEDPEVCFTCMDVAAFLPDFQAPLSKEAADLLQLEAPEEALVVAPITIPANLRETTANLAGTLVINIRTRTGVQLVLDGERFPLKHEVFGGPEESLISFPLGLVGFPELRHFRLFEPPGGYPLKFLQSVERSALSFVCADAGALKADYQVPLRAEDAAALALERPEEAMVLALVVVPEDPRQMTANLAGPLVINTRTRTGRQVVLSTGTYPLRHPILSDR